jgi:hypothetical protein
MTKADTTAAVAGTLSTTALGLGDMDMLLALLVASLTVCLLLIRIGLAVREWRHK